MDVTSQNTSTLLQPARAGSGSSVILPTAGGEVERIELQSPLALNREPRGHKRPRIFYAAPHVVGQPLSGGSTAVDAIDWDATLAFRDRLWDAGLGVAEAMDTAQRGMGLTWPLAKELISLSAARARERGARLVCGAATDQLVDGEEISLAEVVDAYVEQCEFISSRGAVPVVMASRALAAVAQSSDDYFSVYESIVAQTSGPLILHWLGEMFDPMLAGYWGSRDLTTVIDLLAQFVGSHADRIDGIKVSVLSAPHEIALRNLLPLEVRLYTGDDFNYPELIKGDGTGHSDALLGIFNPLADIAATALDALEDGDHDSYDRLMNPTLPLARTLFTAPTQHYKCGIVFLAYLNGYQDHFKMLGGAEGNRSVMHYVNVFRAADSAGVLRQPELAAARMQAYLRLAGIDGD